MSLADNLLRKLDILEAALTLKKSGMPSDIAALCYSDDPADIAAAEQQKLDKYGIKDREVMTAAGSKVNVFVLPWLTGRGIGITSSDDPRISEEQRSAIINSNGGKFIPAVIGTKQQIQAITTGVEE